MCRDWCRRSVARPDLAKFPIGRILRDHHAIANSFVEAAAMGHRMRLQILGRVQGVYYRASAKTRAQQLGLTGWVKNRADGSVELCAEGDKRTLEILRNWCRRGPDGAHVTEIIEEWTEGAAQEKEFSIRA